jgi:hypothetical protein
MALTDFPLTDSPKRMGRPPLSKDSGTKLTGVRLTDELRARIEAVVGPNKMAVFIREAIENELARREAELDNLD